jgi:fatty acid desaturase
MNSLRPVDLQDPRIKLQKPRAEPRTRKGRKIVIALLVGLIVTVMVVWFGFLGWGMVEILRAFTGLVSVLWTRF